MKQLKYTPKYDLRQILSSNDLKIKPPLGALYTIIATWFYVGMIPFMQGTFGSLAVYPIYYIIVSTAHSNYDVALRFWILFVPLLFIGWVAIAKFQKKTSTIDSPSIVIDEVLGMLLVFGLCFDHVYNLTHLLYKFVSISPINLCFFIVFVIFRYYDIKKPLFIRYIDRYMKSAFSVILDDLIAGIFTVGTIIIANLILNKIL